MESPRSDITYSCDSTESSDSGSVLPPHYVKPLSMGVAPTNRSRAGDVHQKPLAPSPWAVLSWSAGNSPLSSSGFRITSWLADEELGLGQAVGRTLWHGGVGSGIHQVSSWMYDTVAIWDMDTVHTWQGDILATWYMDTGLSWHLGTIATWDKVASLGHPRGRPLHKCPR